MPSKRAHLDRRWQMAVLVLGCLASWGLLVGPAAAGGCNLYAAPNGSDAASGSLGAPFASPQRLVDSLSAGQTGCLRGGTYAGRGRLNVSHGGRSGAPLTLTSFPGESARLVYGTVHVVAGSNYVTLRDLDIDGSSNPDVTVWVEGDHAAVEGNRIGNANAGMSCLIVGQDATITVTENVFGDCGRYADGNQDHAIYAAHTRDATIVDNVFWGASGWAIHLYPDAQHTLVAHNVIDDDGGGVIFAGDGSTASSDNTVQQNIITNATAQYLLQSSFGGPAGTGNLASQNCLSQGHLGDIGPQNGFSATANATADPDYLNAADHDYRLAPDSPCLAVVGYDTAAKLTATPPTPPPAPAPTLSPRPSKPSKIAARWRLRASAARAHARRHGTVLVFRIRGRVPRAARRHGGTVKIQIRRAGTWSALARVHPGAAGRFVARARLRWSSRRTTVVLRAVNRLSFSRPVRLHIQR
jgi:Right handed beta helix region